MDAGKESITSCQKVNLQAWKSKKFRSGGTSSNDPEHPNIHPDLPKLSTKEPRRSNTDIGIQSSVLSRGEIGAKIGE